MTRFFDFYVLNYPKTFITMCEVGPISAFLIYHVSYEIDRHCFSLSNYNYQLNIENQTSLSDSSLEDPHASPVTRIQLFPDKSC